MKESVKSVVFSGINQVVTTIEDQEFKLSGDQMLIQTHYSCISAGTELAKLTGLQPMNFPVCLGNRAIGKVLACGPDVRHIEAGDIVFSHTAHRSHTLGYGLIAKLPPELDRPEAAIIGMAMVSLVGVQTAAAELGDVAVVTGGGLVGQCTAQLLQASGIRVILVDPLAGRLELAQTCGIAYTVLAGPDTKEQIMEITSGKGADVVLECTGVPAVAEQSAEYAATSGTIVLVGSPRGGHDGDFTGFLNRFHLWRPQGNLTLKGAHEWKIPLYDSGFGKHNMLRNCGILSRLMLEEKLNLKPLVSRTYVPEEAGRAYKDLQRNREHILGAVFDWKGL